jgi:hypothetical protein
MSKAAAGTGNPANVSPDLLYADAFAQATNAAEPDSRVGRRWQSSGSGAEQAQPQLRFKLSNGCTHRDTSPLPPSPCRAERYAERSEYFRFGDSAGSPSDRHSYVVIVAERSRRRGIRRIRHAPGYRHLTAEHRTRAMRFRVGVKNGINFLGPRISSGRSPPWAVINDWASCGRCPCVTGPPISFATRLPRSDRARR